MENRPVSPHPALMVVVVCSFSLLVLGLWFIAAQRDSAMSHICAETEVVLTRGENELLVSGELCGGDVIYDGFDGCYDSVHASFGTIIPSENTRGYRLALGFNGCKVFVHAIR